MARRKTGPRAWVRPANRNKALPRSKWRYEVVYETGEYKPDGVPVRRTKGGFLTKGDAEDYRDKETPAAKGHAGQAWVDPQRGDRTFQSVADEWLAGYRTKSGKASGYRQHAQIVNGSRSAVRTTWGSRRIGDITHGEVVAWVADLGTERSPSTLRHNFYTFRRVIRFAMQSGLIVRDPTVGVDMPEQRDVNTQQADRLIPTPSQVQALIAAAPEPWSTYVLLAAATGMRPEELTALQLRDVSNDNTTLTVRRVRVKAKDGSWVYEDVPKTKRSRRTIDLDDYAADHLTAYLREQRELATRWFTDNPDRVHPADRLPLFPGVGEFKRGQRQRQSGSDLDWLAWVDADGEPSPLKHSWFTMRYWSAMRAAAGLPDAARFYDLRHFHASWLVERIGQDGALSIVDIAKRLGHASTKMTLDRYAHSTPDRDKRNATAAMWGEPSNVTRLRQA